jgi:hypothetical protein
MSRPLFVPRDGLRLATNAWCGVLSERVTTAGRLKFGMDSEAAEKLGVSLGAVKTLIYRLRKRYFCLLRGALSRTVSDQADVDAEIRALCDALIAAEGRT